MPKKVSIAQNFFFNMFLSATKFLFPLITYPYIARVLQPEGSGKVSFATSLVYYFIMFAELGIPKYGIRKCVTVRDDKKQLSKTVHELFLIQTITTAVAYVAYIACVFMIPKLQGETTLYMVVSVSLLLHLVSFEWLYQALEEYRYIAVRSILFKIISIIAMFALIRNKDDYVLYGAITIIASSASYICNFLRARKIISFKPLGNYNLKQHVKPILVFFAMACAVSIYTHIDTIMLGFMIGDNAVGYYNAATKVKTILVSLMISLSVVLLPRASYLIKENKMDQFWTIAQKSLNFSALFSVPMMIYFVLFAGTAVMFLAGSMYQPAIIPMKLIMPTLFLIGLSYPIGIQMLVPLNKERIVLYSEIAGALVNLIANYVLIKCFGVAGAAVGTVLAEATVLLVQYVHIHKLRPSLLMSIQWWKIIVSSMIGIIASVWVIRFNMNNFWKLAISAACFFGSYGIMLVCLKEPLVEDTVRQLVGKFKRFRQG